MQEDLKTTTFRNGESLTVVRTLDEWTNVIRKSNTPAVLIWETPDRSEYYYNYYAIADPRNILPLNWRLPTATDFELANINMDGANPSYNNEGEVLHAQPGNAVEYDESRSGFYFRSENGAITLWTADSITGEDEFWRTVTINKNEDHSFVAKSEAHKTYGYKVRAIEDIDLNLRRKVWEYKCLLPMSFRNINDSIKHMIEKDKNFKPNVKYTVIAEISIDELGNSKSKIISFSKKTLSEGIIKAITHLIQKQPEVPYYKGMVLQAKSIDTVEFWGSELVQENFTKQQDPSIGQEADGSRGNQTGRAESIEKPSVVTATNLRKLPNSTSDIIMAIPTNATVEILYKNAALRGYVYVRYQGMSGYINSKLLSNNITAGKYENMASQKKIELSPKSKPISINRNKEVKKKSDFQIDRGALIRSTRNKVVAKLPVDGLSLGGRVAYPFSLLQMKYLVKDRYANPVHGLDITLNIARWVDVDLLYCYHFNLIQPRFFYKLYAGGGLGFGRYFKNSPINIVSNYYGYSYNELVDRRRITIVPVVGSDWILKRSSGHAIISLDYRPSIDLLHPSFSPWWNIGLSFRYNF